MSEEPRHEPGQQQEAADPTTSSGATGHGRTSPLPRVTEPSPPGVFRATRAYLLPSAIRSGFEESMAAVCEATRDEGMHELEEPPVLALSLAVVADLEDALAAVDELNQLYEAGSCSSEERRVFRVIKTLQEGIRPELTALRRTLAGPRRPGEGGQA